MDKQKIVLIFTIIILIGVVTALSTYILTQNPQSTNNTTNNSSNSSSNNLKNTKTKNNASTRTENNYIGKAEAKRIVQSLLDEDPYNQAEITRVDFVIVNGVPMYRVEFYDNYIGYDGTEYGWDEIYVGAKDGMIHDAYGNSDKDRS